MAKDPTDGPDTSELEERARGGGDDDHGGAIAHDDDAALLAKLDEFDEEEDEKVRAKKKAEAQRKAEKKKAGAGDAKPKPKKDDDEGDEEKDPPKKAKAGDDDDEDDDEDDAAKDDDDKGKGKEKPAADDDAKDPKEPKKDEIPSTSLNAILREKKRAMADVERARGELVQREHGVQQKERELAAKYGPIEKGQRELEALGTRVKASPRAAVQLLKRLGTTAWEDIANYAISLSDNAKITPEFRRQYSLDDGGQASELDTLRQKQAELEREIQAQKMEKAAEAARQNQERAELAYVDQVIDRAGDEHPFVAAAKKNNPTLLKSHLRALTQELYERDRKVPPTEKVLAEFERRRREEAAAYGLPLPTKKKPTAGENDAANDLANTSRARAAHDDDDDDDEDEEARQARIRKKLDEMDEEDRLKKKQRRK